MDAHNLALVVTPNLTYSSNPLRDVQMCMIPPPGSVPRSSKTTVSATTTEVPPTTLGMVIKMCIQHYYDVFDEVRDIGEAVDPLFRDGELESGIDEVDLLPFTMRTVTQPSTTAIMASQSTTSLPPPSAWGTRMDVQ